MAWSDLVPAASCLPYGQATSLSLGLGSSSLFASPPILQDPHPSPTGLLPDGLAMRSPCPASLLASLRSEASGSCVGLGTFPEVCPVLEKAKEKQITKVRNPTGTGRLKSQLGGKHPRIVGKHKNPIFSSLSLAFLLALLL